MQKIAKSLLRYKVDIFPVSQVLFIVLLIIGGFSHSFSIISTTFVAMLAFVLRFNCPIHQHNHAHLKTFWSAPVNHFYDYLLSMITGFTTAGWELHHNFGHHKNFLNPSQDVNSLSRFKCADGSFRSRLKFAIRGELASTSDCIQIGLQLKKSGNMWPLRKYLIQIALQLATLAGFIYCSPFAALALIFTPAMFYRYMVFWEAYDHHFETNPLSVYDSSQNNLDESILKMNLGCHTAHHEKPTLHWSLLRKRTGLILHKIPAHLIHNNGQLEGG